MAVTCQSEYVRNRVAVILCDRGLMDGKAYMEAETWEKMLRTYGIHEKDMRDNRYDAVFHLITAADGAAKYYNLDTNHARTETIE